MYTKTWVPGSDVELDQLFENLRQIQYRDKSHPLWKNYNAFAFNECTALSITFNDDHDPEFCASIVTRSCWPVNVYRILNRIWRCSTRQKIAKEISPGMAATLSNQLQWVKSNTDAELIFISRQNTQWQKFVADRAKVQLGIEFKFDNYKYCTCEADTDDCWQHIIYHGNDGTLLKWNRK